MIVWTLYRGDRTAFGEYNEEELEQMQCEGWRVAYSVDLTHRKIKPLKQRQKVLGKVVGVNRNGIRGMQ